jgi:hypothetical protein
MREGLGGTGAAGASSLALPLLRACESGGALEGSLGLAGLAVSQAVAHAARTSLEFAPGGGLCCVGPSYGLSLVMLQARA